jgi:hypothetical protein
MAEFKDIRAEEFEARTIKPTASSLAAVSAKFNTRANAITIRLSNGVSATFPLAMLPGLEQATPGDLKTIVIEGRGYALHVPALDADISVAQLFADHLGSGLLLKNLKRGHASRSNGRLGGRPRKDQAA